MLEPKPKVRLRSLDAFKSERAAISEAITIGEFWVRAFSDLPSNVVRGILAEFIVAKALGLSLVVREPQADFDRSMPSAKASTSREGMKAASSFAREVINGRRPERTPLAGRRILCSRAFRTVLTCSSSHFTQPTPPARSRSVRVPCPASERASPVKSCHRPYFWKGKFIVEELDRQLPDDRIDLARMVQDRGPVQLLEVVTRSAVSWSTSPRSAGPCPFALQRHSAPT